jgi:hypothetical protein
MIPSNITNTARIPQNFETVGFGIDNEDFSHIVDILQNQLYSDKPLALVREYCCNAYDANVAAGKKNTPIKVTLPSKFSPHLKIRDFGNGLSYDDMKMIFTRYGKSTKRNDNTTVGCFGIGSKCGFSYTNQFLVNSYQNGVKSAYSCVLTETKAGDLVVLNNGATNEPNGVEVIINIKNDDVNLFRDICLKFFKYWDVMPDIEGFTAEDYDKIRGKDKVVLSGTGWKIMGSDDYSWNRHNQTIAVMGNIGYPVNWGSVKGFTELITKRFGKDNYNAQYFITENNFVFDCAIGEVKMSPSRESLQYTDLTNAALLKRVETILDEVAKQAQAKMDNAINLWEAKKSYDELLGNMGGLNRLRGTMKLNYKGNVVEDNKIKGFEKFGDVKNGKDVVLKTYHRRSSNTNHYCYVCGEYAWNSIECGDKRMILEIDQDKTVYVQKAVKYLAATKNVATVYVLQFKDATQRQAVFAATGLDDSFITKYSTISNDVKNSIVRNSGTGVVKVAKDTTIRSLRYADSDNAYSWRYRSLRDLSSMGVDMADGGIYVETNGNDVVGDMTVSGIIDTVTNIGKYNKSKLMVYFIGQNFIDGKLMKQGKWVKFADYVADKAKEIVKKDKQLGLVAAFDKVCDDEQVFEFENEFVKLIKDENICDEITTLVKLFSDKKQTEKAIVKSNLTVNDEDIKQIKDLFATIYRKFPLIKVLNHSMAQYGLNDDSKQQIVKYLKNNA